MKCRALPWPLRDGDFFPCCHCVDILPISATIVYCSIIIKSQTWYLTCIVFVGIVLFCFLCHWCLWHSVEPFVGKLWRSAHWLVMVWIVLWPIWGSLSQTPFSATNIFWFRNAMTEIVFVSFHHHDLLILQNKIYLLILLPFLHSVLARIKLHNLKTKVYSFFLQSASTDLKFGRESVS